MKKRIGITTTIPIEIVLASGAEIIDLNNIFIRYPEADNLVEIAEIEGYPRTTCAWIKGIYGLLADQKPVDTVIAVCEGDCSNTQALMDTLRLLDLELIPFAFPYGADQASLKSELEKLAARLNTDLLAAEKQREKLLPLRQKLWEIDRLTWEENLVSGEENHLFLISASDFEGDINKYNQKVDNFIREVKKRTPLSSSVRIAFVGIPPIFTDFYTVVEKLGGQVVFNEIQRQFTMPFPTADNLVSQYEKYTYPYDIYKRIEDISLEVKRRKIDGIIHYTQCFCFRQIQDIILRKYFDLPILTIEGDRPGPVDARTRMRLEVFLRMLQS